MNYFKLAMQVFKKHNIDFVKIAVKREKLKQKLYAKRRSNELISQDEITQLDTEIKQDIARINELIGGFLK
jgi:uncharacterized protein YdcH (DUF465 family)